MHLAQEPERVVITIDDDGPGVPASQRDRGRGQGTQGTSEDPAWRILHRHRRRQPQRRGTRRPAVLVALEQASSAPQTREGWRRRGAAFVQRGNGATGGYGASRPGTRPLPASIRTELNRPSRARRRNSLPIARAGRARTLARPALVSSEKAVRSPIPLTRGPGQRLRAVPSGGPRPATNIA